MLESSMEKGDIAVSYTHLDVYKRQARDNIPLFQQGLMMQQLNSEKLLVEGCVEGSYETVSYTHLGSTAQFPPDGSSTVPAAAARHLRCQNAR